MSASEGKLKIALVGLGKRSQSVFPRAVCIPGGLWKLAAVCDPDRASLDRFSNAPDKPARFTSVQQMIAAIASGTLSTIDAAYVAIPHDQYRAVIPLLLRAKIHVLQEKPAANSLADLTDVQLVSQVSGARLMTASQSRFGRRKAVAQSLLSRVGNIKFVQGTRTLSVKDLSHGWRSSKIAAGGGAVRDLGWHLIDLVTGFMDDSSGLEIAYARLLITLPEQAYDCEDSAHIVLHYSTSASDDSGIDIPCYLTISRIGVEKKDSVIFTGDCGVLTMKAHEAHFRSIDGLVEETISLHALDSDIEMMFSSFYHEILLPQPSKQYQDYAKQDYRVTEVIQRIYAHTREDDPALDQSETESRKEWPSMLPSLGEWPVISPDVELAVATQLHKTISIYGNDGVIGEFEKEFKDYHHAEDHFSLLHNSGTNALQALYFSAGFGPGDEVIFPVYTFHATCSPAMHFGIHPVFCDVLPSGNISPEAIKAAITSRTKAIVVTHMWGVPCDMQAILALLEDYSKILLLEDCSHAHGASIDGQYVGTFGDGAVWSLQGQKIVSGGEGGILMTKHKDLYHRALVWGHYNKRCHVELPNEHPLRPFKRTGAGLKHRAHPLAVAIMLTQLRKLGRIHQSKAQISHLMSHVFNGIPFLSIPDVTLVSGGIAQPAWYAYVVRFKSSSAPSGLTREIFVGKLQTRGLNAIVDIPVSTAPLHQEPLFNNPHAILPHVYSNSYRPLFATSDNAFPEAQAYYREAIKFTVLTDFEHDQAVAHMLQIIVDTAIELTVPAEGASGQTMERHRKLKL